ncbi:MAG: hypothetical protein ALECFALPRED_007460 [Alectoria fallacina]|uniref:Uncharacterized protein n=1 Tax=Alectoria fallacina TaxID=1903189 RepID=A0A8H3G7H9_9LECA|nr:MAG: hypothetical protein ALECFALPRED_007460 [Alectoria fallacina]
MYTTDACMLLLLLRSSILLVASAVLAGSADPSTSSDGIILEQQNSTPWTPLPLTIPLNATLPSPNIYTPISLPPSFPIIGTDISLRVTYIGESWFTLSILHRLFSSAYFRIKEAVAAYPDDPVKPLPWFHSLYDKQWRDALAIRIRGNQGKVLTWLQLERVLDGLRGFMVEGEPMQLHPVNFEVNVVGEGTVAAGVLWYSQSSPAGKVEERRRGVE